MSRLSALVLGAFFCLFAASIVPIFLGSGAGVGRIHSGVVQAAFKDLHAITDPVRLSAAPDILIMRGTIRADMSPVGKGVAKTGASRLVLDNAVIHLDASGRNLPVIPDLAPAGIEAVAGVPDVLGPLLANLTALGFETVKVRRGTLVLFSAGGGQETITDINAEVGGQRQQAVAVQGSFTYRGQRLQFDAALTMPGGKDKSAAASLPLQFTVEGRQVKVSFDGRIETGAALQVKGPIEAAVPDAWQLAQWLGIPVSSSEALRNLAAKGQLTWAGGAIGIEKAVISFDGQEAAAGAVVLAYKRGRPSVDATLAFDAFDVAPYLTAALPPGVRGEPIAKVWDEMDIAMPLARSLDADMRFSASKVMLRGMSLGRGAAAVSLKDGKVHADISELEISGNKTNMQMSLDMTDTVPRANVRGRLEMANAGALLSEVLGADVLSGKGTVHVDLNGSASRLGDLIAQSHGKVSLTASQGPLIAFDPKALRAVAKEAQTRAAMPAADAPSGWGNLAKPQTAVDSVDIKLVLHNGTAVIDQGTIRAGALATSAIGSVNLRAKELDLHLTQRPQRSPDRGARPSDAESQTITLRGPWAAPAIHALGNQSPRP